MLLNTPSSQGGSNAGKPSGSSMGEFPFRQRLGSALLIGLDVEALIMFARYYYL
jgi:hypothetical protein